MFDASDTSARIGVDVPYLYATLEILTYCSNIQCVSASFTLTYVKYSSFEHSCRICLLCFGPGKKTFGDDFLLVFELTTNLSASPLHLKSRSYEVSLRTLNGSRQHLLSKVGPSYVLSILQIAIRILIPDP